MLKFLSKTIVSVLVVGITQMQFTFASQFYRHKLPRLTATSVLAVNLNHDTVLIKKNATHVEPIASITKLMTAMVLLDSKVNLNKTVVLERNDRNFYRDSRLANRVGDKFTRKDLLLLMLMPSDNVAAHLLARTTFKGGLPEFIAHMNAKAKLLGMNHTTFYGPAGLTARNRSTAGDVVKMVKAAYNYPLIKEDTTTPRADVYFYGQKAPSIYSNTDYFIRTGADHFPIALSKTGTTHKAGHCLALYFFNKKQPIVLVLLNSSSNNNRFHDALLANKYIAKLAMNETKYRDG